MKKKISLTLALMMVVLSLASCGGGNDTAGSSQSSGESSAITSMEGNTSEEGTAADSTVTEDTAGEEGTASSESTTPSEGGQTQSGAEQKPVENTSKPQTESKPQTGGNSGSASAQKPSKPETSQPAEQPSKAPTMSELQSAVEGALGEMPSMMELSADDLATMYGIDSSMVEAFVCKMPMMNTTATEYLIAKAASGQADAVKKAALKRQSDLDATWKQYLPEQYEKVKNYQLVVNGDYVLFVVADNAAAAVQAFNNLTA